MPPGQASLPASQNTGGTPALLSAEPLGPFPIPTPEQMFAQSHGAKRASSLLTRDASDFVPGFLHRVTSAAPEALFDPDWADSHAAFNTVAWAIYNFNLGGQIGRLVVSTQWSDPPPDFKLLWLGISNWQKDRWDWRSGAPDGQAQAGTGAMERYKHPQTGETYVAVVLLGQASGLLRKVEVDCSSMRGDWWMAGREPGRAACSPFTGPGYPALQWQAKLGSGSNNGTPPVYDATGTIYACACDYPGQNAKLYALRPDGSQVWLVQLPSPGCGGSSPAIDDDGTIYCAVNQGPLYALEPDGTQKWAFTGHGCMASPPAIGPDGTIYILGGTGTNPIPRYLHALNKDGSLICEHDFSEDYECTIPAIATDGTVYAGCSDKLLYAFNPDGSVKWTYETAGSLYNPVINKDGIVYFTNREPRLYAVNPDGTLAWSNPIDGSGSLALSSAGLLYIRSGDRVYAYGTDGTLRWSYHVAGYGAVSVDGAGNVYTSSSDSRLYAIGPDGVLKWWYTANVPLITTPVIAPNGTIYMIDSEGSLHAIGPPGQMAEYAAAGYVMDEHGDGLAGVTMTVTGEEPVVTDAGGYWSKAGLTDGTYLVSPTLDGYTFSPLFEEVNINGGDAGVADFVGSPVAPPVWAMWGGNCARTHCSPRSGPATPGLRWSYLVNGEDMRLEPAIGGNGAIYVQGSKQGLYAFNPDGSLRWKCVTGYASRATPAIASDGTIYTDITCDSAGQVRAFTPGGVYKWTQAFNGVLGSLAIAPSGAIIQNTIDGLASINLAGIRNWLKSYYLSDFPALTADGVVYATTLNGMTPTNDQIVALNPDSSVKWLSTDYFHGWHGGPSAPNADDKGTLYFSHDIEFIALNDDGTTKWIYETGYDSSRAAIGPDGTIFFTMGQSSVAESNNLVALNPDGSLKWEYNAGGNPLTGPPTVDVDGAVYVSLRGLEEVRAINPDGSLKWICDAPQAATGTIAVGADGTLYFGDAAGYVYALGSGA
jgi:large repetitive protein